MRALAVGTMIGILAASLAWANEPQKQPPPIDGQPGAQVENTLRERNSGAAYPPDSQHRDAAGNSVNKETTPATPPEQTSQTPDSMRVGDKTLNCTQTPTGARVCN